jgi:predicted RND superfamily exporter protein
VGLFPLAGALLSTAALLALLGEPLSMMNVPVALPVFGLGVDYAVFLMDALEGAPPGVQAADAVGRRSAPLFGAWLSTLAGGAALLVADHPAARTIGAALVIGEGASLVFAWTAVPWLVGRRGSTAP